MGTIRLRMTQKEIAEGYRAQIPVNIMSKMIQGLEISKREKEVVNSKGKSYVRGHTKEKGQTRIKPQLRNLPGGKPKKYINEENKIKIDNEMEKWLEDEGIDQWVSSRTDLERIVDEGFGTEEPDDRAVDRVLDYMKSKGFEWGDRLPDIPDNVFFGQKSKVIPRWKTLTVSLPSFLTDEDRELFESPDGGGLNWGYNIDTNTLGYGDDFRDWGNRGNNYIDGNFIEDISQNKKGKWEIVYK